MIYLNFILIATLITLSIIDWKSYRIPNFGILILLTLSLVTVFLNNSWGKSLVSSALIFAFTLILYGIGYLLKKKPALGIGDIKLFTVLGLTLGLYDIPQFFIFSGVFGLLTNLYFRFAKNTPVSPLGPAICLSYLVTYYGAL